MWQITKAGPKRIGCFLGRAERRIDNGELIIKVITKME